MGVKNLIMISPNLFDRIRDFLAVLRGTWFTLFFNILALFAFLLLSQGQDMLFSIADNFGRWQHIGLVVALLAALFFWSVCSGFSTRMLIYMTDNSGKTLSPDRVNDHKCAQKLSARTALYFTVLLLTMAFLLNYAENFNNLSASVHIYNFWQFSRATLLIVILLIAELLLLRWLYAEGRMFQFSKLPKALSWMAISVMERGWLSRLYGMLNDVRLTFPLHCPLPGRTCRETSCCRTASPYRIPVVLYLFQQTRKLYLPV